MSRDKYDMKYYEDGIKSGKSCYVEYRWLPSLTIPMAHKMVEYLGIALRDSVLDFGCAKGYLVKAFRDMGIEAYGVDVSAYAIANAPGELTGYVQRIESCEVIPLLMSRRRRYEWFIAKDVFEHLEEKDLHNQLLCLSDACLRGFAVIPLSDDSGKYVCPEYDNDITHRIRRPMSWWAEMFEAAGFRVEREEYRVEGIKDKWASCAKGNGFFTLSRKGRV